MQHSKRIIFQIMLQICHADTFRQRCIDFQRFAGNTLALFILCNKADGAHVMRAISQLHQKNAHILAHRQQQFTEIFSLHAVLAGLHANAA